jgi:hypothetical protein
MDRPLAARKLGHRPPRERAGVPPLFARSFASFADNELEEAPFPGARLFRIRPSFSSSCCSLPMAHLAKPYYSGNV